LKLLGLVFTENKSHTSSYLICVLIHRALFNAENHIDTIVSDCQTYYVGEGLQISGINGTEGAIIHNTQNNAHVNSLTETYRTVRPHSSGRIHVYSELFCINLSLNNH